MYGFAILSSPSFRQAARFAVQYHQLETPVTEVTFGESGDDGKWVITPLTLPAIDSRLYRFIVELQFGTIVSLSRDVMGPSFTPKELRVTYGPMQARKNYDSAFGSPIMYGQPENAVVFNRKWLGHSPELGNEPSYRETIRLCDQLLKEMKRRIGVAGDVREILLHNLTRSLSIDAVSKRLKIPVRTLKRRLQEQGTSYRQIADELKSEIAIKYLRETSLGIESKRRSSIATRVHQMNHSMYSANRTTHLKIVVIALALVIAMANLAIELLKNRYRGRDQGGQANHAMSGSIHGTPRSEAHHAT